MSDPTATADLRPAAVCRQLLAAMAASEGRRKRRKRDTTPDAIGLGIKRDLLARAADDDPPPDDFESWLLEQCLERVMDLEGRFRASRGFRSAERHAVRRLGRNGPRTRRPRRREGGDEVISPPKDPRSWVMTFRRVHNTL